MLGQARDGVRRPGYGERTRNTDDMTRCVDTIHEALKVASRQTDLRRKIFAMWDVLDKPTRERSYLFQR